MIFHRFLGDKQRLPDFAVAFARCDLLQDFDFPVSQFGENGQVCGSFREDPIELRQHPRRNRRMKPTSPFRECAKCGDGFFKRTVFENVPGSACLDRLENIAVIVINRQNTHSDFWKLGFDPARQFDAVHFRHPDVRQKNSRAFLPNESQGSLSVRRLSHYLQIFFQRKKTCQRVAGEVFVFGNQKRLFHRGCFGKSEPVSFPLRPFSIFIERSKLQKTGKNDRNIKEKKNEKEDLKMKRDTPYTGSRRDLFRTAGAGIVATGLSTLPTNLSAQGAPQDGLMPPKERPLPPSERVGYAIVGLGEYGTQQIIPSFAECGKSRLAAVVSGTPEKAQRIAREYGVPQAAIYDYKTMERLKDNPDVQVVYVILPNALHLEYTVRAARIGKHVLCEKPMATSVKDAETMIQECAKAGRKLMIGYRAQYEPYNLKSIELARGGTLGKLKSIVADHGRTLNPAEPRDIWRAKKALAGGGSLMDIGIYSLNACRYLTGEEPVSLQATQYSTPGDPRFAEVEETIHFMLRFPSGVLANCTASYGWQETKRYQVFGDKMALELDPATDYYEHRLTLTNKEGRKDIQVDKGNQFARMLDHFSDCVKNNKTPKTPGEEGLRDLKLMLAIYEAAKTGRTLRV